MRAPDGRGGALNNLSGKKVLVTNAGVGFGQDIAVELARLGARVAVQYAHSERDAAETSAKLRHLTGGEPAVVQADLRAVSECNRTVQEAAGALGGLDVLVNNPGVPRDLGFLDTNEAVYDELFDLNVRCYLLCTKRAVSFMLEACGGSIVNVTCIHNQSSFTRSAGYAATEGAVIALTSELAEEFRGKGIRINAVGPGLVEVPRYFGIPGYTVEFGSTPMLAGRLKRPRYVAHAVSFLATSDVDFTGQVL
jgi:NAD(P)-dependent dehydrogenase (short-subunit alcohol dehydrogenase family)